uniref:Putative ionotropic glutamate receptor n=1 Tax=Helianthus annuus TaxID=4232 RepID=A0A251S8X0_HELAN
MLREKIQSNHSKVVVMTWLFVVFILTSCYTASLTSILTVRMLEPTVRDIDWLRKTNAPVGCDPDSFVGDYLTNVLKLKNIKNVSRQDEYPDNFKNGNISAAFLELPYQKYFLNEYCNEYTAVGPSYKFGGLGFVDWTCLVTGQHGYIFTADWVKLNLPTNNIFCLL